MEVNVMNTVTLTKEKMLCYLDAQMSFPKAMIKDVEQMKAPIKLDGLKEMIKSIQKIKDFVEQSSDDKTYIIPNITMQEINDTISSAKNLQ